MDGHDSVHILKTKSYPILLLKLEEYFETPKFLPVLYVLFIILAILPPKVEKFILPKFHPMPKLSKFFLCLNY